MSAKKTNEMQEQQSKSLTGIDAVRQVRNQLKIHEAMGIKEYPLNADMVRFLELTDRRAGVPGQSTAVLPKSVIKTKQGVDLELLRQEMTSCTLCHLSANKLGTVQGFGNNSCRLMVIGDWSQQEKNDFSKDVVFGPEEDVMFWKMMTAIELAREEVFVTNCIKCCPGNDHSPDTQCEKSCFSFLEREIAAVKPDVICAMGDVAAKIITNSLEPLTRLRGKFGRYRYEPAQNIIVMPTFHPRFLLKIPDMKKATWLDLQAVKRRLEET